MKALFERVNKVKIAQKTLTNCHAKQIDKPETRIIDIECKMEETMEMKVD